jgi:hypothetical protein
LPPGFFSDLAESVEESSIPYDVDIVDLRSAAPTLLDEVRREGVKWKGYSGGLPKQWPRSLRWMSSPARASDAQRRISRSVLGACAGSGGERLHPSRGPGDERSKNFVIW